MGALDPGAPIAYGRNFNYYNKYTVTNGTFNTNADIIITFQTYTVTFDLESTGVVQYSFNGNYIAGEMDSSWASKTLVFQNRALSKIWFKLISGSGIVRVEAWSTQ